MIPLALVLSVQKQYQCQPYEGPNETLCLCAVKNEVSLFSATSGAMPTGEMRCRICHTTADHAPYGAREMMFGFRDRFTYFQCRECDCLQIAQVPADMSKYYPSTYGDFGEKPAVDYRNPIERLVRRLRNQYAVLDRGFLGRFLYSRFPSERLRSLATIQLTLDSRILDVGCGIGAVLYSLRELGFSNLFGVDPYLEEDISYPNGLRIQKRTLSEVSGEWDLIMFHHSFEHVPDPFETLFCANSLLSNGGVCLIRVPVMQSYAWSKYGTDWVQLDPPRHFFLHSVKSITVLARQVGLTFDKIVYDSTGLQFWGSEQYRMDIPHRSERSYFVNPASSVFSRSQIVRFAKEARKLNKEKRGDQAAFYLRKKM